MVKDNKKLDMLMIAYSKALENINKSITITSMPMIAYKKAFENISTVITGTSIPMTAYKKAFENISTVITGTSMPMIAYKKASENISNAITGTSIPVTTYSKALENISNTIIETSKPMTTYSKALENISNTIIETSKPMTTYSKALENISNTIIGTSKPMTAYKKAFENIGNAITSMDTSAVIYSKVFEDISDNLNELVEIMNFDLEKYNETDTSTDSLSLIDDKQSVEKLVLLDKKIDLLVEQIEKINQNNNSDNKNTKRDKKNLKDYLNGILYIIIFNFFIGIIFGLYDISSSSLDEFMVQRGKFFASSAIEYFEKSQDNKEAKSTRMLHLYKKNRKDSERLDSIVKGTKVEIITKKKKWTKVRYLKESNNIYKEGWVLTRYLTK